MYNFIRLIHIILILFIALLFTRQSFGQYRLIQTFSETSSFGSQVSGIGNVNGDDYDDIIVLGQDEHKAYIYYGGNPMDNIVDVILNNVYSVSGAGDVNGDGYDDVIAGDWSSHCAYLYYGSNQMDNTIDQTFEPTGGTYSFGSSVAGVGDVNHDSYDDIIIGDDGYTGWLNDNDIPEVGRAIIYFGGSPEMNNSPDITLYGEIAYSNFGFSVSGAGDFNNDTYDDVIVGAPGYDQHRAGRAYIFYGGYSMDSSPDLIMEGVDYSKLGTSVSGASDVNYDGYDDVIVGMPGYYPPNTSPTGNGRVDIYYGAEDLSTSPYVILPNIKIIGDDNANLGKSISGAGNVNNDNFDDIIIGESTYSSNTGRVYIYFGDVTYSMDGNEDVIIEAEVTGEGFGVSVSGAGDVNNDGKDEVIVGADSKAYIYSIEKVCEGDYTLTSQEEVDEFYSSGCERITGNLTITGPYITNLDGLSELKSIRGDLTFYANERLTNISGLSELTSIEGNLYITNNPGLLNIDGLSNLISVGQNLLISSNINLNDLKGLSGLTSIGAGLRIDFNPKLINIDGLSSLESVGDFVGISNNDKLEDIGLSSLTSIENSLTLIRNNALTNINGLSALTSVGGNLDISYNDELLNIDGLSSLLVVGGNLSLYNNPNLTRCCGLYPLLAFGRIGGSKDIRENGSGCTEDDILAFGYCNCEGDIYLGSQADVDKFALIGCNEIGGNLTIRGSDITNLSGLSGLTSVDGGLYIEDNDALTNLDGLSSLISIGGSLIVATSNIRNLNGLAGLTSLGGSISIVANRELINIDALSNLTCVLGNIDIYNNDALESLEGLSGLTSVGGRLNISTNYGLDNLNGLSSLTSIGGTLYLISNLLSNIDGLSGLTFIGGSLTIDYESMLSNLNGLLGLTSIGSGIGITFNSRLTNIDGLQNLTSIDGIVTIYNNDELMDLDGLHCLTSVEGLLINNNEKLINIDGLSSLMSVGGNLSLYNNPNLSRCCGLYPLLAFGSVGGSKDIRDNGSGCTEQDIRSGGHCRSCDEDFVLTSQAEVDHLYTTGCTVMEGSLTIQGLNITNIDALTFLTSIYEDLYIINNPLLTNLDGFINLTSLGGDLIIENNPILTDLDGLSVSSLSSIGKDLKINNNITLTNLNGLSELTYVGGDILLTNNPLLTDFSGLYPVLNIGGVAGSITIEGNGTNPAATEILFVGLNEKIEQLHSTGLLNEGQSVSLIIRLEEAIQKLNRGKTKTAINILNSIINQVNSFITEGILTEAEGREIISPLNEIINLINGEKGLSKKGNKNITDEIQKIIPENYSLAQNYPNPFNPITTIIYGLPEDAAVVLKIFNVLGAEVMRFTEGFKTAGYHKVSFDASDLSSGIYFYRLQTGTFVDTKKMILLK
jgi:hypothetical protein